MQHARTALVVLALATATAHADPDLPWRLSLDTDPTTYPLGGFSGWAMVKPAGMQHLRVGAGGFGLSFPSFLVPTLNGTGEDGWGLSVRAVMAFAGYQVGERRGLYVGAYTGYLQSRHTRDDEMGTAVRDNITVIPTVGYQWFPIHHGALSGLYLQPWAGATVWIPVGGTSTLGTHTFKDPHVIPIAAFHIGYEL